MSVLFTEAVVDLSEIVDAHSFHSVFNRVMGFPDFYGDNMDAWIDCMTSLDCPEDGISQIHAAAGGVLVLSLRNTKDFKRRCPALWQDLEECSAFVNWRRIEGGRPPVLVLSYHD